MHTASERNPELQCVSFPWHKDLYWLSNTRLSCLPQFSLTFLPLEKHFPSTGKQLGETPPHQGSSICTRQRATEILKKLEGFSGTSSPLASGKYINELCVLLKSGALKIMYCPRWHPTAQDKL